jgi:hypothetical protein
MKNLNRELKIRIKELVIILSTFFLVTIGIVFALKSKIQMNKFAIFTNGFNYIKILVCFLLIIRATKDINKANLIKKVSKRAAIYLNIIFIFMWVNIFCQNSIFTTGEYRYGIRDYKFLFTHPTYMVASICILLAVIQASNLKKKPLLIGESLCIIAASLRSKAFLFIVFFLLINLLLKYKNKIRVWHAIVILTILIIAIYKKANFYIQYGYLAARSALILMGIDLANNYFPFGIGFGAFSGKYYTSIYSFYNVDHIQGLSVDQYNYSGDMFWPVLLGEVGYIGLAFYLVAFITILMMTLKQYKYNKNSYRACIYLIGYLLIASAAESILGDVPGMMYIITMNLYLGQASNLFIKK